MNATARLLIILSMVTVCGCGGSAPDTQMADSAVRDETTADQQGAGNDEAAPADDAGQYGPAAPVSSFPDQLKEALPPLDPPQEPYVPYAGPTTPPSMTPWPVSPPPLAPPMTPPDEVQLLPAPDRAPVHASHGCDMGALFCASARAAAHLYASNGPDAAAESELATGAAVELSTADCLQSMGRHFAGADATAGRLADRCLSARTLPDAVAIPACAGRAPPTVAPLTMGPPQPQPAPVVSPPPIAAPQVVSQPNLPDWAAETPPQPPAAAPNAGPTETARETAAAAPAKLEEDPDYALVRVFYATDRLRGIDPDTSSAASTLNLAAALVAGLITIMLAAALWLAMRKHWVWSMGAAGLALGGVLAGRMVVAPRPPTKATGEVRVSYGNQRGQLDHGVCEVSIPKSHQVGQVESPSILRLEFSSDERKHVVLRDVMPREPEQFFDELRSVVREAPSHDVFVFVHGYNVTFDNAARRTAQMAYDLKFEGAPIFYSWPSQGGLLAYTVDENNVEWTVPHLKQFLLDVAQQSQADAVNLIAHSMGNRALTKALRELTFELRDQAALFNQVVLAAPDVDAEVFRRDIAPAIVQTARRVTLYASSDDQALQASRQVHGYARAGDSGAGLVVIPGIDTIDVSGIDTSLLGHSYYGGSGSILSDLYHVIREALPAKDRRWLEPQVRDGLPYWIFRVKNLANASPNSSPTR